MVRKEDLDDHRTCHEIMRDRKSKDNEYSSHSRLSSFMYYSRRKFFGYDVDLLPNSNKFWLLENEHLCDLGSDVLFSMQYGLGHDILVYLDDFAISKQKQQCMFCQFIGKIIGRHGYFSSREMLPRGRLRFCFWPHEAAIYDENDDEICTIKMDCYGNPEILWPKNTKPCLGSQPVNWRKVNDWLKQLKAPKVLKEQPLGFRVIDIEKACVVPAPPFCEYIALSYVWGAASQPFQATLSNIGLLECDGSLLKPEVPATIKDAMYACSRLNKRYLWVDRFCIVQDHPPSRDAQIDAMGLIYSHSLVTLIAIEGSDADFGLCGVSRARPDELWFQGLHVAESYELGERRWKWMTRGWTLQESVLSRHLLIFTEKSVHFKESGCRFFQSDLKSDLRVEKYIDATPPEFKNSLYWYGKNVNDYTKRTLGTPRDTLRAFTGIMNRFFGRRHLFGLPFAHFGEALLWYPTGYAKLRKPEGEDKFPTWSWASNTSPVKLQDCVLTIALCAATVSNTTSGQLEWSIVSIPGLPTTNLSNLERGYHTMDLKLARMKVLVDGELMFDWEKTPFDRNNGSTEERLLKRFSLPDQFDSPPRCDCIAIYTHRARLMLDPRTCQVSPGRNLVILRSSKFPVGFLFLDNVEREESIFTGLRDGEEVFRDNLALSINILSKDQHVQFSGSSTTAGEFDGWCQSKNIRCKTILGNGGDLNFLPPELVSVCPKHDDIFILNVMAVEKSDSGIFRRIGLGQVFLEKWAGLNPEVGTFMIE